MARTIAGKGTKKVAALTHEEATRKNIPTAELQSIAERMEETDPVAPVRFPRRTPLAERQTRERDPDLDPQILWNGARIRLSPDQVRRLVDNGEVEIGEAQLVWRGKEQCIYFDPPYGIKFNSNWQVSTQSRDVKDGKQTDISREPEQVKAFRDTWKDGIHSYLTYLRDRLTVARDLLHESGSIFVQIGDENVHRVRALMDEVFGPANFVSSIWYKKHAFSASNELSNVFDNVLWSQLGR